LQCIERDGSLVIGEKPNCEQKGMIEIAAYAYDRSRKPFQHPELLKTFKTMVQVDVDYRYELEFKRTETIYRLFAADGSLLETVTIGDRVGCAMYSWGLLLDFYFGGQCPAPQDVSMCYK